MLRIMRKFYLRSPFPWSYAWGSTVVGANEISKSAVIEEGFPPLEFLEMDDNSYSGFGVASTTHLVEGRYGALILKKIKIGKNAVVAHRAGLPPGGELGDNSQLIWNSAIIKNQKINHN